MAMTKAEQKRMADLEHMLRLARAFRWPDYPQPSPMTYEEIKANLVDGGVRFAGHGPERVAKGWFCNAYEKGHVNFGCSNGINHSDRSDYTTTQGMGQMFRTELEAWQRLRHEKTLEYAEHLARIDAKISELQ